MATNDTCCTIAPYFKVHKGKMDEFRVFCKQFVEATSKDPKCLNYGFAFDGESVFCREGYVDGDSALAHLEAARPLIQEVLKISDLTRLEIHGPDQELAKLREPLADLNPQFFTLEYGFRR